MNVNQLWESNQQSFDGQSPSLTSDAHDCSQTVINSNCIEKEMNSALGDTGAGKQDQDSLGYVCDIVCSTTTKKSKSPKPCQQVYEAE